MTPGKPASVTGAIDREPGYREPAGDGRGGAVQWSAEARR